MNESRGLGRALGSLDAALLAVPFQWLVDFSQRRREWWVEQCAYALLVFGIVRWVMRDHNGWATFVLIINVCLSALFVAHARIPVLLSYLQAAGRTFRIILLVSEMFLLGLAILGVFINPETSARFLLNVLSDFTFISIYYFAACEPPAPPRKREETKLGFAA
jgi:hypothetical protein